MFTRPGCELTPFPRAFKVRSLGRETTIILLTNQLFYLRNIPYKSTASVGFYHVHIFIYRHPWQYFCRIYLQSPAYTHARARTHTCFENGIIYGYMFVFFIVHSNNLVLTLCSPYLYTVNEIKKQQLNLILHFMKH